MNVDNNNIEQMLLDYAEGNLGKEHAKDVELFLEQNPEYQQMLALYDKTMALQDNDAEVFANKKSLKKSLVPVFWKYTASVASAVAVILLLLTLNNNVVNVPDSEPVKKEHSLAKHFENKTAEEKIETPFQKNKTAFSIEQNRQTANAVESVEQIEQATENEIVEQIAEQNTIEQIDEIAMVENETVMDTIKLIIIPTEHKTETMSLATYLSRKVENVACNVENNIKKRLSYKF